MCIFDGMNINILFMPSPAISIMQDAIIFIISAAEADDDDEGDADWVNVVDHDTAEWEEGLWRFVPAGPCLGLVLLCLD